MSVRYLRAAQFLTVLLALPMTIGSVMFSIISPERHQAVWKTWTFAPVAFACGVGLLALTPRLAEPPVRRRVLVLLGVAQAFSVTKLIAFHESASVAFLVVGFAALGLLWAAERPAAQPSVTA